MITHSFELPLTEIKRDWRQDAKYFYGRLGYKLVFESESEMLFRAGSKLGNILSFNPAKIERELVIKKAESALFCTLNVSLDFRSQPNIEIEYTEWEIGAFYVFLKGCHISEIPPKPNARKAIFISLLGIFKMIAINAVIGILIVMLIFSVLRWIENLAQDGPRINLNENLNDAERAREGLADVYIMPFYGFSEGLASALAAKLSEDLKINVRATASLPMPENAFDNNRQQYNADAFYKPEIDAACNLKDLKKGTVFIGIVPGSIFIKGTQFRYVFACQFDTQFSVVGDYEMRSPRVPEGLYHARLYKIVKRQIGKTYYKKPPSADKNSVMKSPVMSVEDLDDLGFKFLVEEKRKKSK